MLGSTEKAIHVVGKTTFVLIVLVLITIVGFGVYNIKKLGERRQRLCETCDQIDDAMSLNRPQTIEKEEFVKIIKSDWEKRAKPQPLRAKVFYQ